MKVLTAIVIGMLAAGLAAYGCFALMNRLIPPGEPVAVAAKPYNDPRDFTPREPNVLPAGPHQDDFALNCIACHSTRLTFNQPSFPAAKWKEIVKKMVTDYGAKIDPPQEELIVQYLTAVKGTK